MPRELTGLRLHQLEGFFHVARHGGYARAVAALPYPITEPALHQQVRKLERTLGARLLERAGRRGMIPTPAGRRLLAFVTPFFERVDSVLHSIAAGSGLLAVGAEALYAETLCPEAVAALHARWPDARFQMREMEKPAMVDALLRGEIDVAVSSLGETPPTGLRACETGVLGLVLAVPAGHPLARRRGPPEPVHLAPHRFVVYEAGTEGRDFTERALAAADLTLVPAAEASSAGALRALVRAGVGPAFIPVLGGTRPRRRTCRDGTIELDLTEQVAGVVDLPRFGWTRRAGEPGELLAAFCAEIGA
jgi:DNA-binding transcriptional LysR family regulator